MSEAKPQPIKFQKNRYRPACSASNFRQNHVPQEQKEKKKEKTPNRFSYYHLAPRKQ